MDKNKFQANVEMWKSLSNDRLKQEQFFYDKLLEDVVSLGQENWQANKNIDNKKFDLLITMSGFSPETSIIASKIIQPKKILVISSINTAQYIDKIGELLIDDFGFKNFHHDVCDPTDPLKIYKLIKDKVASISENGKLKAIVDITGGKKIMSAAASLVAWQLDMPICYIENANYDPVLRRPVPGGEQLLYLPNPITLYGDNELSKCKMLFNKGQFLEACGRLNELADRLEKPQYAKFLRDLSQLYYTWCDIDIDALESCINKLEKHITNPMINQQYIHNNELERMEIQINFLKKLIDNDPVVKILNFYLLGLFYKNNLKRYDFACLFFYRAMEGCFTYRLKHEYNINQRNPNFNNLSISKEELEKNYVALSKNLNGHVAEDKLPNFALGYGNSAGILMALNDKLFKGKCNVNLGKIVSMGELRNASILAHGYKPLKFQDARRLESFAQRFIYRFCELESEMKGDEIKDYIEKLKFISLENN